MKKAYVTPTVEKVEFQYDRVVAASGTGCTNLWNKEGTTNGCKEGVPEIIGTTRVV